VYDIDDDNDGILDANERIATPLAAPSSTYSTTSTTVAATSTITNPSAGFVVTDNSSGSDLSFTAVAQGEVQPGFGVGHGTISEILIDLDAAPNESVINPILTASVANGFDDGLLIQINDVTVVEFDGSDFYGVASINAEFDLNNDNSWGPWSNEGQPELEIDLINGTVQLTALTKDGTRKNILDYLPASAQPNLFPNFDATFASVVNIDSDSDGIFDHLDVDSDNDGITDNIEAQSTANYIAPSGVGGTSAFIDANSDGLDDRYDDTQAGVGQNTGAS